MNGKPSRPILYSGPLSMFGAKAQIAALEKSIDVELIMVPFEMRTLYQPKHPEVLRINPKQQVPVLVHGDLEIFDSTQIFEYLEDLKPQPPLWPCDLRQRARARLLEHKSDEVFFPPIIRLMGLQATPNDPAAVAARDAAGRFYVEMEKLMDDGRDWLAEEYSYADIAFFMAQIFADRMGAPMPDLAARLFAWRHRMSARPAVRQVAGAMGRFLLSQERPLPGFLQGIVEAG
jgi:glutathione S-transferase